MDLPKRYADTDSAGNIAKKLYPQAKTITFIDHGYDNLVVLVDSEFALRFPRNEKAYLRGFYEKHILEELAGKTALKIPTVISQHNDPPYTVTSFVPGQHISADAIQNFSDDEQSEFSRAVARFAYTMHSSLNLDEEALIRKDLGIDELPEEEPWPDYFKRLVLNGKFTNKVQEDFAKKYYNDWVKLCDVRPTVVVHDDLHTQNMMFENNHLIGILDFGDTNIGTPEQELRQLYRISERVADMALKEYERLSGQDLSIEALKIWSVIQEIATYSKTLMLGMTTNHGFKRSCHNLNIWFSEGEWGKGYDLSKGDIQ